MLIGLGACNAMLTDARLRDRLQAPSTHSGGRSRARSTSSRLGCASKSKGVLDHSKAVRPTGTGGGLGSFGSRTPTCPNQSEPALTLTSPAAASTGPEPSHPMQRATRGSSACGADMQQSTIKTCQQHVIPRGAGASRHQRQHRRREDQDEHFQPKSEEVRKRTRGCWPWK